MYGANLSSESLPGGGHTKRHSSLQHLIQDMMRIGNIDSVLKPVNFFHGKVGQPFIRDMSIISQVSQAILDMQGTPLGLTSMPQTTPLVAGRQVVNASGATRSADAILKHITSVPQDITTTTKTLTQQINVHER